MLDLQELLKLCCRTSVVPELLVVLENIFEGRRERGEVLPLVIVKLVDLLPDQRIGSQQNCQAAILMPRLFELREVPPNLVSSPAIALSVALIESPSIAPCRP